MLEQKMSAIPYAVWKLILILGLVIIGIKTNSH